MKNQNSDQSIWPYKSLLLFGFFGPDSTGGKKLMLLSTLGLLLFIAGFLGTQIADPQTIVYLSASLIPLSILFIIYANATYIHNLDSLEKLIQLKAFSAAYGSALFIGFTLFAISMATNYYVSPVWLVLAEPFRGICLYTISKSYK